MRRSGSNASNSNVKVINNENAKPENITYKNEEPKKESSSNDDVP
jgi:hypothetical protein